MKRDEKYVKVRHRVVVFECKDVLFELATVKSGSLESMRERGGVESVRKKKKKSVPRALREKGSFERDSLREERRDSFFSFFSFKVSSLSLFLDHLSF
jgi:hypothetical protein